MSFMSKASRAITQKLDSHPGHRRLFAQGELTVGLIMPLETHPGKPAPTMADHASMAVKADQLGFAALWLRDVPFYDPDYGDVAQVFDPIPYIGYLTALTQNIVLGTTGIVLPLREPLSLAKQIASLDQLSTGRVILGISSGDRPADYPLFGVDFDSRGARFRESYTVFKTVTEQSFPSFDSQFGRSNGGFDLIPKPFTGRTPTLAVGQAQQSLEWIATNLDGLIRAAPDPFYISSVAKQWQDAVARHADYGAFKPLGLGMFLDLFENAEAPMRRIPGGFRSGRNALIEFFQTAKVAGIGHIALNPKVSHRPYADVMEELAEEVLPLFPSHGSRR
ncbi:LLM class oxidoreductase [Pseudomonas putida]|uniref:LLM class oxidoreductase n=1 Tax=Pseudomonas putida TaxID=303 RepID=UPI0009A22B0F|nr:LLM class oxidoreductase [Pseudomonas putida]